MSKNFCAVSEKIGELYTSNISFLAFILWIRRMLFWHLCWELLGKNLKRSLPKSINDWNYLFYAKFVLSEFSFRHFTAEILRFLPWKSESVEFFFSKTFFCKMLVWTSRMQLWWYLRHFLPESWKSSARIHKLMEKKDLNLKDFFLRKSRLDTESAVLVNFPNFLTRSPNILSSKSETDGNDFFWLESFSPVKISETVEGSFRNPVIVFVRIWEFTAHSPKKREIDKYSNKFFSEVGWSGHFGYRLDNPTEKFCSINPHLLSLQILECEAHISNRNFAQKLPLCE